MENGWQACSDPNISQTRFVLKKDPLIIKESLAGGGQWRIRTAVHGFADRCLTTRPTDQ